MYLNCAKFVTTREYAPRRRAPWQREQELAADASARGWERERERHACPARCVEQQVAELDEPHGGRVHEADGRFGLDSLPNPPVEMGKSVNKYPPVEWSRIWGPLQIGGDFVDVVAAWLLGSDDGPDYSYRINVGD
jgi:hypothetical protein